MRKHDLPAVLVRLQPDVKATLQAIADSQMRSLSNLALKVLTEYAEQAPAPPAKQINGAAEHKKARASV